MTIPGLTDDDALRDLCKGITYSYMSQVHGDFAEFGCFWGQSARSIAAQMQHCDDNFSKSDELAGIAERKLWLFDSFQGLPTATLAPDTEAPQVKSGAWTWTVEGANAPTPASVTQACSAYLPVDRIKVIPGWYKDTLAQINDTKFALVHVDCDLYESAYQVLDHLFGHDMLSDGCALFFDDWYCNRGHPQYGEQQAWREIVHKHGLWKEDSFGSGPRSFTDWGPYGVVGRKFIVHR